MNLPLDTTALERSLAGGGFVHRVEVHEALESTNDRALEILAAGEPEGVLVVTEEQTRGRGRRGRAWHSPRSLGIYASLVLRPRIPNALLPMCSMSAALGVLRALEERGITSVRIKWPNDLLLRGKKLGGILAEAKGEGESIGLVVGLGLNVNQTESDFPDELRATCTSIFRETGRLSDRTEILGRVLVHWEDEHRSLVAGGSERLARECLAHSAHPPGSLLQVDVGDEVLSGRFVGLGSHGELLLDTGGGAPVPLSFGEVRRVREASPCC